MCAADQRIELVLHRRFGQVAAELGEQRRLLHPRQRRLLVEQRDDVLADGVEAHPLFHQDRRRDRALLAQDAEQQVLGADVVVQQPVGFFGRELQHALGFRAERESRPRSRPSRGTPCALRFPCGCFRGTGASARRSGSSAPCPRGSVPAAGARSQWRCCRAGWLRSARRTARAALVPCSVRTSGLPIENGGLSLCALYGNGETPASIFRPKCGCLGRLAAQGERPDERASLTGDWCRLLDSAALLHPPVILMTTAPTRLISESDFGSVAALSHQVAIAFLLPGRFRMSVISTGIIPHHYPRDISIARGQVRPRESILSGGLRRAESGGLPEDGGAAGAGRPRLHARRGRARDAPARQVRAGHRARASTCTTTGSATWPTSGAPATSRCEWVLRDAAAGEVFAAGHAESGNETSDPDVDHQSGEGPAAIGSPDASPSAA